MSGRNPIPREQAYEGVRAINPPDIVPSKRNPLPSDFKYPLGTFWLNTITKISYQLVSNPGNWALVGVVGGGDLATLTADAGVATPVGGNINIDGGLNITTSAAGDTVTIATIADVVFDNLEVTSDITLGGNLTSANGNIVLTDGDVSLTNGGVNLATGNIDVVLGTITSGGLLTAENGLAVTGGNATVTAGDLTVTVGDLVINGAGALLELGGIGSTLEIHAGNVLDSFGSATLVAGVVAVLNTAVTAKSKIMLTMNTPQGTPGFLSALVTPATGFTIHSTNAGDASIVNFLIINTLP